MHLITTQKPNKKHYIHCSVSSAAV